MKPLKIIHPWPLGHFTYKKCFSSQLCADKLFATNKEHFSQVKYVPFLKDGCNDFQWLFWSLYKAKRVNRSVSGGNFVVYANAFDMFYDINYNFQLITGYFILSTILTDSMSLFDILTKASFTTKKCSKINLLNVQS